MPILSITVENPDELLNASYLGAGALARVERSATGGGAGYSEIGTTAILAATRIYTYYDLAGAVDSWYRVRYSKSDGSSPSEYGPEFQTGDETGGLICSLYDVKQRLEMTGTTHDETLLDLIRAVTAEVEGYTGRDFTGDQSDQTFRVRTEWGYHLWMRRGIQSVTSLAYAVEDQPATGGTYTATSTTDYYLEPSPSERDDGWPATRISFRTNVGLCFYDAAYGAQIVGRRGFASVPQDVQRVGQDLVLNGFLAKGSATGDQAVAGPSGQPVILRDPRHRAILDRYRAPRIR